MPLPSAELDARRATAQVATAPVVLERTRRESAYDRVRATHCGEQCVDMLGLLRRGHRGGVRAHAFRREEHERAPYEDKSPPECEPAIAGPHFQCLHCHW